MHFQRLDDEQSYKFFWGEFQKVHETHSPLEANASQFMKRRLHLKSEVQYS